MTGACALRFAISKNVQRFGIPEQIWNLAMNIQHWLHRGIRKLSTKRVNAPHLMRGYRTEDFDFIEVFEEAGGEETSEVFAEEQMIPGCERCGRRSAVLRCRHAWNQV